MDTQTRYPRRVARPKYAPPDEQTEARIANVVALHQAWIAAEAKYKAEITSLTDPADGDVPIAYAAERLGVQRKTVYRHTGRSMT
jgi:hypothetical protein